jgi:hypothetical protein
MGFAGEGGELRELQLVTNSRLSICRVRRDEWEFILGLAGEKEAGEGEGKDASDETAEDVGEAK